MAITRVRGLNGSFNATSSYTVPWTGGTAAGNLLVVIITFSNPGTARTVTPPAGYLLAVSDTGTNNTAAHIYYYPNAPSRTTDQFIFGGGNANGFVGWLEYSGCDPTSPLDQTATNPTASGANTTHVTGTTATTSQANEVCVGIIQLAVANATFSGNPTNSFTRVAQLTTPTTACMLERIVSATGTYGSAQSLTSNVSVSQAGAIATFKEAAPASSSSSSPSASSSSPSASSSSSSDSSSSSSPGATPPYTKMLLGYGL